MGFPFCSWCWQERPLVRQLSDMFVLGTYGVGQFQDH